LKAVYELQLDGKVTTLAEALEAAEAFLKNDQQERGESA
jgi:hypothetical protein